LSHWCPAMNMFWYLIMIPASDWIMASSWN
jgi:hypothetical protein